MSDTVYTDIRSALTARLLTLGGLPDVAWENKDYKPVLGTPYLRPEVLWAEPTQAAIGDAGANWEKGIYQITLVYPDGEGNGRINAMSGKLKDLFKRGTSLAANGLTVRIKKAYLGPQSVNKLGVEQPLSVQFYCQAPN
jgi:hypothetical protein